MAESDADALEKSERYPESDVRNAWRNIFSDPTVTTQSLRARASEQGGLSGPSHPSAETGQHPPRPILRSIYWRFYHGLLPPPSSLQQFPGHVQSQRKAYNALRRQHLVAPDGRWAADCTGGSEHQDSSPLPRVAMKGKEKAWDPLNLEGENPWKAWFASLDLRATIRQDVERTFPDMPYFTIPSVRMSLTTILFLYSVLNPDVGYRQGMHELLAAILMAIDLDSLLPPPPTQTFMDPISRQAPELVSDRAMVATLDRTFVEHDAFTLFSSVMETAKTWYEWRAEEGPRIPGQPTAQAPIIALCNRMQDDLLRRIDPQLWERLETEGVEAQIWGIRWIRLILTRELRFDDAMQLWDGMFADDPKLGLLEYVCVAMLLRIRNELLNADYPTILTNLLRYPGHSTDYPLSPLLLLSQAKLLRNNVSPTTGVQVVLQNHEALGIKPAPEEVEREVTRPRQSLNGRGRGRGPPAFAGRAPPGVQGLAQGLIERAQAAGLDKAFMSTVADLRKNLPDLSAPTATAYSYIPALANFSPLHSPSLNPDVNSPFSSIPSSTSPLPSNRFSSAQAQTQAAAYPQTQQITRTLREADRELAELRLAMLGMGKALDGWLKALNKGEEEATSARQGISNLKDTLLNAATLDTSSIVHEWGWSEALETPPSRTATPSKSQTPPDSDDLATTSRNSPSSPAPTPPLYLSSRHDRPASALSRTPQIPATRDTFAPVMATNVEKSATESVAPVSRPVDPLSGLGVNEETGVRRTGTARDRFGLRGVTESSAHSGVDPLLGLDV